MKKTILHLIVLFFFVTSLKSDVLISTGGSGSVVVASGGSGSVTMQNVSTAQHYPDVTFYDKMDSVTSPRAPTKGSGKIITTANISLGPPLESSSTASNYCNLAGFRSIGATVTANIDLSKGRAGFYLSWDSAGTDTICFGWKKSPDVNPRFLIAKNVNASQWDFKYSDVVVSRNLSVGATGYVEVAWDINATHGYCAEMRINGGTYATAATCSGGTPSPGTNNLFGWLGDPSGASSASIIGRVDEVLISTDSERDLYAIRDRGNYPN